MIMPGVSRHLGLLLVFSLPLLSLIVATGDHAPVGGGQKTILLAEGTLKDADGNHESLDGEVQIFSTGGKLGDFKKPIKQGRFEVDMPPPAKDDHWPLKIKLAFYVKDTKSKKEFPPRYIEHLNPRQKQTLHIVIYTDEQLKKATTSILFSEFQQLEQSVFVWLQSDKEFKKQFGAFYSFKLLDSRRQMISATWRDHVKGSKLPIEYFASLHQDMSDEGRLGRLMEKYLQ